MEMILIILVAIVMIPTAIFAIEVLLSLLPQRSVSDSLEELPTFTILIPAHNEAGTINKTLEVINQQITSNEKVLVVADNCTDDTAVIARRYGAEAIERTNEYERGKGFALDFGVRHLEATSPTVVIIIDADCIVKQGALQKLACASVIHNRPIQALYMMQYSKPSLKQRISEFAWLVKNKVRPLGLFNIGLPCQLMGTGMAFPWKIISSASLATSNIVEDMKMGLDMAQMGYAPIFLPNSLVTSSFPEANNAEQEQKKRWEHGQLNLIFSVLPSMLIRSVISRSKEIFVMVLDLMVPPLALLTLTTVILTMVSVILFLANGTFTALILSLVSLLILTISTLIAWMRWGRSTVSLTDLLMIPVYVISKVPLYILAVVKRQKEWIRTDRND